MARIYVDRDNRLRLDRQIIKYVTAPAGDHEESAVLIQPKPLDVHTRVLPDLVVHQSIKPECKKALESPLQSPGLLLNHDIGEFIASSFHVGLHTPY